MAAAALLMNPHSEVSHLPFFISKQIYSNSCILVTLTCHYVEKNSKASKRFTFKVKGILVTLVNNGRETLQISYILLSQSSF